ncbi:leucine-rich repeat-containing protein 18 [Chanos chanos]|uniref:Leucine-rich repeat-containing protein 18 n=1 Tax=Chanos chanos TaxID=29144 RepID=A0A6J2V465_CHACN|nr:leucine-rich repeat-containing protein 18 [Chanos chanos]
MAKGKKKGGGGGRKITLKLAKKAVRVTPDGRTRLDLSNMGIATFPKCLLKLRNVEELDLSRNRLRKIPEFLGQLTGLLCLDLHSNQIEQLPRSIGQLGSLRQLNLCNNCLDSAGLPLEIGHMKGLRVLNLGMNRLTFLPPAMAALTNLTELGLFDNLLTEVPECIRVLPNLKKINAKGNPAASAQDESKDLDPDGQAEGLYLVREDGLCAPCLERCKEERKGLKRRVVSLQSQRRLPFSGLSTPNSVAQQTQELWRNNFILSKTD